MMGKLLEKQPFMSLWGYILPLAAFAVVTVAVMLALSSMNKALFIIAAAKFEQLIQQPSGGITPPLGFIFVSIHIYSTFRCTE